MKKVLISISAFTVLATSLFGGLALAQNKTFQGGNSNRGVVVTPVTIYLTGDRGQTISNETTQFKVTNDFGVDAATKIYPKVFNIKTDLKGTPITDLAQRSLDNDFAKWINLDTSEYNLEHNEIKDFKFTVKIPDNAAGGSHMAIIVLPRTQENPTVENAAAFARDQIGIPVFLTINKDIKFSSQPSKMFVTDIADKEKGFFWGGTARIQTEIFNDGNIYTRPQGNIFIHKGDKSKSIQTFKFNDDATLVGKDSKRLYSVDFSTGGFLSQEVKDGKIKSKLNWGKFFDFKFGRYYATYQGRIKPSEQVDAKLLNGQDAIVVEKTVSFYVFPIQIVILLGIAVLMIVIFIVKSKLGGSKKKDSKRL
jgi:hypothetical protein